MKCLQWDPPYALCDFGLGELSIGSATPEGLDAIFTTIPPPGKVQVMTMPKTSSVNLTRSPAFTALIRTSTAYSYALGGHMMAPWDIYMPGANAPRYFGLASEFADVYEFVRSHAALLDAATTPVPDPRSTTSESAYNLTYSGGTPAKLGLRFRFPFPYTTSSYHGPKIGGAQFSGQSLESCEKLCDADAKCKGLYFSSYDCYTLHALVQCDTELAGASYTRNVTAPRGDGAQTTALAASSVADVRVKVRVAPNRSLATVHIVDWRDAFAGQLPIAPCTRTPQPCPSNPGVTFCNSDPTPGQCQEKMPHRPCPPCPLDRQEGYSSGTTPLEAQPYSEASTSGADYPAFRLNISNAILNNLRSPATQGDAKKLLGASCLSVLKGCWPVQAQLSRCRVCEGRQQQHLKQAGCSAHDIDAYCGRRRGCGELRFILHSLGDVPPTVVNGTCQGGVTVLTLASPKPWAMLEVRPRALKLDDDDASSTQSPPAGGSTDTCTAALQAACPRTPGAKRTAAGVMLCDVCASKHQQSLRASNCSAADVQSWCATVPPVIVAAVSATGSIDITLGDLKLAVSSTFTEAVGVVKECESEQTRPLDSHRPSEPRVLTDLCAV